MGTTYAVWLSVIVLNYQASGSLQQPQASQYGRLPNDIVRRMQMLERQKILFHQLEFVHISCEHKAAPQP